MKTLMLFGLLAAVFGGVFFVLRTWGGLQDYGWETQALAALLLVGIPLASLAKAL